MFLPAVSRNSRMAMLPPSYLRQRCCCLWWREANAGRILRLAGGIPRFAWRKVLDTSAASRRSPLISCQTEGCLCPIRVLNMLFHDSAKLLVRDSPLRVAMCWFHTAGGNKAPVGQPFLPRRRPFTYVSSKYWTSSSASGWQTFWMQVMPRSTSDGGNRAKASNIPTKLAKLASLLYKLVRPRFWTFL